MSLVQRKIFKACYALLKKGGSIVFSTCTFNPMENEQNVRWILDTFSDLELADAIPKYGGDGLVGPGMLTPEEAHKVQRFDPRDERMDCIGFFIAKFRRL